MVREKVVQHLDPVEVTYTAAHRSLLAGLREEAEAITNALSVPSAVYGSVARGDVHRTSDVDVLVLSTAPSYAVEMALTDAGLEPRERSIVKATPNSVPKAHLEIDERRTVTLHLAPPSPAEEDFYRFGGLLAADHPRQDRVPGVTKRLVLVEPTAGGHRESSVLGREATVARLLGIGVDVVHERVRVLTRRDKVGRTGVYLREAVPPGNSIEEALSRIAARDPAVRRQLRGRGR